MNSRFPYQRFCLAIDMSHPAYVLGQKAGHTDGLGDHLYDCRIPKAWPWDYDQYTKAQYRAGYHAGYWDGWRDMMS